MPTGYLIPSAGVIESDLALVVLDTGSLVNRLHTLQNSDDDILIVVTSKELTFLLQNEGILDVDLTILLSVPDAEYDATWHMMSNSYPPETYEILASDRRQTRAGESAEAARPALPEEDDYDAEIA